MKNYINNKDKKDMRLDFNGNVIYLLTTWEDGSPNAYERAHSIANAATAEAWRAGLFKFPAGKPATAADFFDEMPYTSSSDFAAVWNCSRDVVRASNSALRLEGVALAFVNDYTEPRAVLVWREYNATGDEMRDVYEVAGDSVGTIAEIAEARAQLRAEIKTARDNATTRAQFAALEEMEARAAVLRNNERAQVAALACENLRAAFSAFSGRQYGEATAAKMRAAFKNATGGALTFYPVRAYNSARAYRVEVQRLTPEGYTTPNGEAVEIWRDACGAVARDFINEANTIQSFGREELRAAYLRAAEPWTKDTAAALVATKKYAKQKIEEARDAVRVYMSAKPEGMEELKI